MKTLDPQELKSKLKYLKISWTHDDLYWLMRLVKLIDSMSTIEVEPVQYGRWEWVDGSPDNYDLKCTICGGVQDSGFWERCPYCGARMESE